MRNKLSLVSLLVSSALLGGCTQIDEGHVGVYESWGEIIKEEVGVGVHWYNPIKYDLIEYNVKEVPIDLDNLTPKAGDNLSLMDFDVTIYFQPNPSNVAEIQSTQSLSTLTSSIGDRYPAYNLIHKLGRDAAYKAVGNQPDSLAVNTNREQIKSDMMKVLELSKTNGWGEVTRIVLRSVVTDPSVETSIQALVELKNEEQSYISKKVIAEKKAEIKLVKATATAEANRIISASLTPELINYQRNQILESRMTKGSTTMIVPSDFPMINLVK